MTKEFDIEKFNNDPAFEKERATFDQMFEGSFNRFLVKQKANTPPEKENVFDELFGGIFGKKKDTE